MDANNSLEQELRKGKLASEDQITHLLNDISENNRVAKAQQFQILAGIPLILLLVYVVIFAVIKVYLSGGVAQVIAVMGIANGLLLAVATVAKEEIFSFPKVTYDNARKILGQVITADIWKLIEKEQSRKVVGRFDMFEVVVFLAAILTAIFGLVSELLPKS